MKHALHQYMLFVTIITVSFLGGVLSPHAASATTYYVAKTGSDANSCTAAQNASTPKLTLSGTAGGVTCLQGGGDTLIVKVGTYTDGIDPALVTVPSGTSWANAVMIKANPGDVVRARRDAGD